LRYLLDQRIPPPQGGRIIKKNLKEEPEMAGKKIAEDEYGWWQVVNIYAIQVTMSRTLWVSAPLPIERS